MAQTGCSQEQCLNRHFPYFSTATNIFGLILLELWFNSSVKYTLQPLYNKVRYNMISDITWFKDGSQKCIDYIEK